MTRDIAIMRGQGVSTLVINNGQAMRYLVVDENGKQTGESSFKYRDITGDEAMRLFGTTRTVRVGVKE